MSTYHMNLAGTSDRERLRYCKVARRQKVCRQLGFLQKISSDLPITTLAHTRHILVWLQPHIEDELFMGGGVPAG